MPQRAAGNGAISGRQGCRSPAGHHGPVCSVAGTGAGKRPGTSRDRPRALTPPGAAAETEERRSPPRRLPRRRTRHGLRPHQPGRRPTDGLLPPPLHEVVEQPSCAEHAPQGPASATTAPTCRMGACVKVCELVNAAGAETGRASADDTVARPRHGAVRRAAGDEQQAGPVPVRGPALPRPPKARHRTADEPRTGSPSTDHASFPPACPCTSSSPASVLQDTQQDVRQIDAALIQLVDEKHPGPVIGQQASAERCSRPTTVRRRPADHLRTVRGAAGRRAARRTRGRPVAGVGRAPCRGPRGE